MTGRSQSCIVALGGGGFGSDPGGSLLDRFILDQAGVARPRVCFIPTATGDDPTYLKRYYDVYSRYECEPADLPFFARTPELRSLILNQDVIFVGGGNTRSMLAVWREWGLDDLLREAWHTGTVLAGVSAGAICWFEQGLTDSHAGELTVLNCLGFLAGSCSPHYDGEADRRPSFQRFIAEGRVSAGIALDDCAAAVYIDGQLSEVVASRAGAGAYQVRNVGNEAEETPIAVRYLKSSA